MVLFDDISYLFEEYPFWWLIIGLGVFLFIAGVIPEGYDFKWLPFSISKKKRNEKFDRWLVILGILLVVAGLVGKGISTFREDTGVEDKKREKTIDVVERQLNRLARDVGNYELMDSLLVYFLEDADVIFVEGSQKIGLGKIRPYLTSLNNKVFLKRINVIGLKEEMPPFNKLHISYEDE